ncbi:MAG TPA: serine hydrolase [Novosphingobium sp.]|nr:serine hydrolase [Novosphingobium sp.]
MAIDSGFCPDRLDRLRGAMEQKVAAGDLPHCILRIDRMGKTAFSHAVGTTEPDGGRAVDEHTIHRIHSLSKPIVSVALLTLVEEGRIALDDPLGDYIPELADVRAPEAKDLPVLIIDLLRHTSGFTYHFQNRTSVDARYRKLGIDPTDRAGDMAGLVERLAQVDLEFAPGTAWNYSLSTDLVGCLVERITGTSLDQALSDRLFKPLGMLDTGFDVNPANADRLAALYALKDQRIELIDRPHQSSWCEPAKLISGGGGLTSTVADYARFTQMMLDRGRASDGRILSPTTIDLMTSNHLPGGGDLRSLSVSMFSETSYTGIGFGLGVGITLDPVRSLMPGTAGDYFWGGASGVFFWVDPVRQMSVIFMTQLMGTNPQALRRRIRTLVYAALMEADPVRRSF